jgi:hypothetical protein
VWIKAPGDEVDRGKPPGFNVSGEEGHQRKAKAMAAPSSEDDGALVRESDEEKKVVHQKDPHVGQWKN